MPPPESAQRDRLAKKALFAVLALLALVSLWGGVRNALAPGRSQDFQWSGTHLLLHHIDPWQDYLDGDPAHGIYRIQIPNYLPLAYVLLAPLGLLSIDHAVLVWVLLNILFAIAGAILCGRFFGLDKLATGILLALLLLSTPARNTLGNGQQGLLVLFLWVLALCRPPHPRNGLPIGLSYFKYSFAPPVFLFLWFRLGVRAALLSLVPAAVTLLTVYAWLGGSLLHPAALFHLLVEPLKVTATGYYGDPGTNLMDALQWALAFTPLAKPAAAIIVYAVPIALAAALLFRVARRRGPHVWPLQIALLALLSILLFKHHAYDGVVLLFPVAFCLKHLRHQPARWALLLLAYPWYADKLLRSLGWLPSWSFLFDILVLAAATVLVSRIEPSGLDAHPQL